MAIGSKAKLWNNLLEAERKARASKVIRLVTHPVLYPFLMFFNKLIYPVSHKSIPYYPNTFFGLRMKTLLPSGTDLALNGIKGHDSEIRLSAYLVQTIQEGDTFIDVGAHYGYYTLLAYTLVGSRGIVHAVEASSGTARILEENSRDKANITLHRAAASDRVGEIVFYEYPGPYAEWNTTVKDAYQHQSWIKKMAQVENRVPTIVLDDLFRQYQVKRAVVKIDIEGGELAAIRGMQQSLGQLDLILIMEYHHTPDEHSTHREATRLLHSLGYRLHCIDSKGQLLHCDDIDAYMVNSKLTTDNLVFKKNVSH